MQLTAHNQTNAFIDSCCDDKKWGGLNEHGRSIIAEMNRLGMLINVAHASDEAILQAVLASRQPVIYSRGGFRGIVNHPRCITDEAAKALAAKGGVIGIQFGSSFNNPKYAEWAKQRGTMPRSASGVQKRPTLSLVEVDREVVKGIPYVFRGTIPDEYWMATDQLARVVDYGVRLVGENHIALGSDFDGGPPLPRQIEDAEARIRKIPGQNWLRVIRQVTEHG